MTVKDGLTRRHCTLPTELWALMDKLAAEAGVPFRAAHETAVEAGLRLTPAKVLASTYAADRRRAAPLKKEESAKARRMKKAQEGRDHATAQARKAEVPIILAWVKKHGQRCWQCGEEVTGLTAWKTGGRVPAPRCARHAGSIRLYRRDLTMSNLPRANRPSPSPDKYAPEGLARHPEDGVVVHW